MPRLTAHIVERIADDGSAFAGIWRFASYGLAALLAACIHYGIMAALILGLGEPPVFSSSVGAVGGTLFAFVFNYRVTFADSDGHWGRQGTGYLMIAGGLLFLNGVVLKAALLLGTSVPAGQLIASLVCFKCSYLLNRRFTFGA